MQTATHMMWLCGRGFWLATLDRKVLVSFWQEIELMATPRRPVLTLWLSKHHASASCAMLHPRSAAMGASSAALAICARPSSLSKRSLSQAYSSSVARVPLGMPPAYLPVKRPEANGDQIVVPRPMDVYKRLYSRSTRSRENMLYCGCSIVGPAQPSARAIPEASAI